MSSVSLVKQAWNPATDEINLADLYPALGKYCPYVHDLSPQQALFLLLDSREAFYGGAAGGGKTWALLAAALQYVDVPGYAALLLRRTFPQLSQPGQLIPTSKEWLGGTDAVWNEQQKEWRFPSGAVLKFGHVKDENAVFNYQGGGYHFIGWDELTQFTPTQFEYVSFSRQRRDKFMRDLGIPIRVRASANPGGIGHAWVKARYIDGRDADVHFIPAKVADNVGLDVADYVASLSHLGETLRRQLLDGDWGAFEGAALQVTDDHLIETFPLEDAHSRFECADYGLNGAPWALWPIDYEGNLIAYDMLYEENLLPSQLAPLVLAKRKHEAWGFGHKAYADPSIWHRTGHTNEWGTPTMLADLFGDAGVPVLPANNDPRAGLIRLRELLKLDPEHAFPTWHPRAGEMGAPRLFLRRATERAVEELRAAPLQPIEKRLAGEIVSPPGSRRTGTRARWLRYASLVMPKPSLKPVLPIDDPRAALLAEVEARRDKQTGSKQRYRNV
jgi:hypothetical protein